MPFHGLIAYFFLLLNSPLNECTIVGLPFGLLKDLGCFQFGAVMNRAAGNIHMKVLYGHKFSDCLGKNLQVQF